MTPAQLTDMGLPRKAGLVVVPLPPDQSTLRRPDGNIAQTDMMLKYKGHSAAAGEATILHERRAVPHWPVLVPLTAGRVMAPVLVPAKAGSTERLIGPAPCAV